MADSTKVTITERNGVELDFQEEYELKALNIPYDNTGKKFNATDVKTAIDEIREKTTISVEPLVSTLNGNHNIIENDSNLHDVTGTATGYTITLPDATSLFVGRVFKVANSSSETIQILDNSSGIVATLIAGDTGDFILENNSTAAGNWLATIVTSAATGITSYVVASNTTFSTTSTTDALITGFAVTPASGRYSLFVSGDATITGNNRLAQYVAYVGGAAEENTRRQIQGVGSNYNISLTTIGEITVNGSQAVDVRVNISANSLDINARSLILIRLGAA